MGISTDAEDGVRRTGSVSHIGNKHKRQDMYQKYRKEKAKRKLQRRLKLAKDERSSKEGKMRRKERLATSKPRTIENTRDFNPTVLNVPNTHEVPAWMEAQQRPEPADRHNDDEEEEEEEEAEHDDEEEIPLDSLPSSASLSEQALASRHNRIRINNTEAMQRVYEDMRLDGPSTSGKMPWIETMSLVYEHATADEVPDAQNDLDRELSFYRQSLAAAIRGRELVLAANVSFSRPNDYFAEMVKTDEHMERVRQRLLDESASIKASEDAKRQRELKKYGKKIQTEKLFERQRSKRDMQEKVNALKRKRQTGLDMDDDEFDVQLEEALGERKAAQRTQRGPNKKRQYRDEKYGFGGKKRHSKSNTAESTDQVGPSRRKPGQRPKGGKAKRPGKARRAARR